MTASTTSSPCSGSRRSASGWPHPCLPTGTPPSPFASTCRQTRHVPPHTTRPSPSRKRSTTSWMSYGPLEPSSRRSSQLILTSKTSSCPSSKNGRRRDGALRRAVAAQRHRDAPLQLRYVLSVRRLVPPVQPHLLRSSQPGRPRHQRWRRIAIDCHRVRRVDAGCPVLCLASQLGHHAGH